MVQPKLIWDSACTLYPAYPSSLSFRLHTRSCFILAVTLLNCHFACSQGSPNSHPSEELLKQPDYSDKLKQMLGNPRSLGAWGGRPVVEREAGFPDAEKHATVATGQETGWGKLDRDHGSARLVCD